MKMTIEMKHTCVITVLNSPELPSENFMCTFLFFIHSLTISSACFQSQGKRSDIHGKYTLPTVFCVPFLMVVFHLATVSSHYVSVVLAKAFCSCISC